jgi:hypothetical protein
VLERQQLLKDQQKKKLEAQREKQDKKEAQQAIKKAAKKMKALSPGYSNKKKLTPKSGLFRGTCSLLSPAHYTRSDSESESSSSYRNALLSGPATELQASSSASDSDPGGTTLVTLEPNAKPKEDPDTDSGKKQPPDFRPAGS